MMKTLAGIVNGVFWGILGGVNDWSLLIVGAFAMCSMLILLIILDKINDHR